MADVVLVGREVTTPPGFDIEDEHVLVETGVRFGDEQSVAVGTPSADGEPAVALVDADGVVADGVAVLDVHVEDGVVTAVRDEGEAITIGVPPAEPVFGVGVSGQIGDRAVGDVEAIDPSEMVSR